MTEGNPDEGNWADPVSTLALEVDVEEQRLAVRELQRQQDEQLTLLRQLEHDLRHGVQETRAERERLEAFQTLENLKQNLIQQAEATAATSASEVDLGSAQREIASDMDRNLFLSGAEAEDRALDEEMSNIRRQMAKMSEEMALLQQQRNALLSEFSEFREAEDGDEEGVDGE